MNTIWLVLILMGVAVAGATGQVGVLTKAVTDAAGVAVDTAFGLAGVMALWLGLVRIAAEAGLMQKLSDWLSPLASLLFPDLPRRHPAIGAMTMNISANLLGLGSAATPLGLNAMTELQKLNPNPDEATPAMVTFMALNTSSITLVPGTIIALRAVAGSQKPADVVLPALIATMAAAAVSLSLDAICRWWYRRRQRRC